MTGLASAEAAAKYGVVAALICAGVTLIVTLLGVVGVELFGPGRFTLWNLVDVTLFGVIAWGIHRANRIAAIAGLIIYVAGRLYTWSGTGSIGGFMFVLLTLYFVHGVRGTFAVHRYSFEAQDSPDASNAA